MVKKLNKDILRSGGTRVKKTRRQVTSIVTAVVVIACLATSAMAQQPSGPSIEETKAWLESEGLALMQARRVHSDAGTLTVAEEGVESLTLDNCGGRGDHARGIAYSFRTGCWTTRTAW